VNQIKVVLADQPVDGVPSSSKIAAETCVDLMAAAQQLNVAAADLNPTKIRGKIFNPSSPSLVGPFISLGLLAQPRLPLADVPRFYGSGVYALYYRGDFAAYAPISGAEHPVYVGKADPAEPTADTQQEQGEALSKRLKEHARSISRATTTLDLNDFDFRCLVITSGWQASAESFLIHLYRSIWNNETGICHGIGKHGDDAETRKNGRSPWDTLHPGRPWANKSKKDQVPELVIKDQIAAHFGQNPPLMTLEESFSRFFEALR